MFPEIENVMWKEMSPFLNGIHPIFEIKLVQFWN